MPDAVVGRKLGDALIGVVDTIRGRVRRALGTRPYRTFIVTRTWSGSRAGSGSPTDSVLELEPPPMVEFSGADDRQGPAGREHEGGAVLTEVSLRYTEAELSPPPLPNTEVFYVVSEDQGQAQSDRFFVLADDPRPRRGDQPGDRTDWIINLRRTADAGPFDRTNAP